MKAVKAIAHGLALCLANFTGIWIGFMVARSAGGSNPSGLHLLTAVAVTAAGFLGWRWLVKRTAARLWPAEGWEYGALFACSLIWAPLLFVPLHYETQGYFTEPGNLIGLLLFQLFANGPLLFFLFAAEDMKRRRAE